MSDQSNKRLISSLYTKARTNAFSNNLDQTISSEDAAKLTSALKCIWVPKAIATVSVYPFYSHFEIIL